MQTPWLVILCKFNVLAQLPMAGFEVTLYGRIWVTAEADVHHQSFPEMVPEDQDIYSDDDGYHRHQVRHGNHRSRHCDLHCDLSFRSPRIRHVLI